MIRISRLLYGFSKKLKVEYCMAWRYDTDFENLKDKIHAVDKTVEIEGKKTTLSNLYLNSGTGKF